jgi:uncharacterized membrane protein YcaP (DUF421 family)
VADEFQISVHTALTVVVTTLCIYIAFILMVRLVGSRALTSTSIFDFACIVAFGSILGRTVLLQDPTLAIGVVALATFLAAQGAMGLARQNRSLDRWLSPAPVLLPPPPPPREERMRRAHVVEDEVRQAVRRAGACSLTDVRCVVLERNGQISVVRSDRPMDPWLLADVATDGTSRP